MKILVLNYTHPEGYPPTFNAINNLSKQFDEVHVLSTQTLDTNWVYDKNVILTLLAGVKDRFQLVNKSKLKKIASYYNYIKTLWLILKNKQPEVVLIYDNVPFLFYFIASKFLLRKKPLVWYHNHDVFPLSVYKKYTINWLAAVCEQKYFNIIDVFSLPSNERKKFFPLKKFLGDYLFLPNFPSKYFHGKLNSVDKLITETINIIYPGNICHKHGFEELIPFLKEKINNKQLHLTLLGDINPSYKTDLDELIKVHNVENQVHIIPRVSYFEVPKTMKTQHIGWAVNKPLDATYATAGTAANKIYEFLALSMPIILFDNNHYRAHLDNNDWAFFTDLSSLSLKQQFEKIITNYKILCNAARNDFEKNYLFETKFEEAIKLVKNKIER